MSDYLTSEFGEIPQEVFDPTDLTLYDNDPNRVLLSAISKD